MAFRFELDRPTGSEVARVIQEQLDHAIDFVSCNTHPLKERIHRARTSCKKARATLRLVRTHIDSRYGRENAWLRDSARLLAPLRDAEVVMSSFKALTDRYPGSAADRDVDAIRRIFLRDRAAGNGSDTLSAERTLGDFVERLRASSKRFTRLKVEGDGFGVLAEGFGADYRRARRAFKTAYADGSRAAFHEWRKRAKAHGYHVHLLRCTWPAVMKKLRDEHVVLTELLGDEHDLSVLEQYLDENAHGDVPVESIAVVLDLIEARREELRAQAEVLGQRVYAEKKNAAVRLVARWWDAACREHQENSPAAAAK